MAAYQEISRRRDWRSISRSDGQDCGDDEDGRPVAFLPDSRFITIPKAKAASA